MTCVKCIDELNHEGQGVRLLDNCGPMPMFFLFNWSSCSIQIGVVHSDTQRPYRVTLVFL